MIGVRFGHTRAENSPFKERDRGVILVCAAACARMSRESWVFPETPRTLPIRVRDSLRRHAPERGVGPIIFSWHTKRARSAAEQRVRLCVGRDGPILTLIQAGDMSAV